MIKISNPNKLWFTSDTHFNHANIIKYCNRPYKDKEEMDADLITRWNNVIGADDEVIHCGDFMWHVDYSYLVKIRDSLHGRITLVMGNHDNSNIMKYFPMSYNGYLDIRVEDNDNKQGVQLITACHFPMLSWNQSHEGSWHVYGHWHGKTVQSKEISDEVSDYVKEEYLYAKSIRTRSYDVGVDGNNYCPISYNELKNIIRRKEEGKL